MWSIDTVAVLVELALALIFLVAGVAKLTDLKGSRRAVADFGVPERLARPAGVALPLAEIATAAALLIHPIARWGAAAAVLLLLVFIVGVANAMRQGKDVDCGCFGPIYSATAGSATLVRNGVLGGLALFLVISGPGPAIDDWIAARTAAELAAVALAALALALGATVVVLWRRARSLRAQLESAKETAKETANRAGSAEPVKPAGLPIGTAAPRFELPAMREGRRTLEELLRPGVPVVLIFTDPSCGPANRLVPDLARWQEALADKVTIAVIAAGSVAANEEAWSGVDAANVLLDADREVTDAYDVLATPTAVPIHGNGRIAGVAFGGQFGVEVIIRLVVQRAYDGVTGPSVDPPLTPVAVRHG